MLCFVLTANSCASCYLVDGSSVSSFSTVFFSSPVILCAAAVRLTFARNKKWFSRWL